ncbi:hypothetical protein [Streptomyces sp. NPDC056464]|uniref:hypothetical protein n=1 Tax=Streptomyces sp. NPDC056464 TaxID=3345828 RepID=UPI0036AB0C41
MYEARDARIEDRPDLKIVKPMDAVVRTLAACACGNGLWPEQSIPDTGRDP